MLCIKSLQEEDRLYPLDGFKFSLGSAQQCDIVIADGMLNPIHALLWVGKDFLTVMTVEDAVITVKDELVTDRAVIKIGEKVSFADHEMELIEIETEPLPTQTTPASKDSDWILISRNQEMKGQKIVIEGDCSVGRARDNTICIPVISLSRHHAVLRVNATGLCVSDNQSANGTFVNGKSIGEKPVNLQRGDIVAFDKLEFLVYGPEENIFSDQTSVRAVKARASVANTPGPTAIDRQKISISEHKPESFTERFEAIQEEQYREGRTSAIFKSPILWLGVFILLGLIVAVLWPFASTQIQSYFLM